MIAFRKCARAVASLMAAVVLLVALPAGFARAALVSTEQLIEQTSPADARARLTGFLARDDVRAQMVALGVDPAEALARTEALSDAEVAAIAGELDRLPAGQSAVGAVIGAALFIFLVLLITDLLGLTDVFPFVRR